MASTSLPVLLGLRGQTSLESPPSFGAFYLIFHFVFAYGAISSRPWKMYYRLDHQVCPRQDLDKYGAAAVASGKLSQRRLDQMRRVEACHANSVEHFSFFAAALIWAHVAGVSPETINARALAYTAARVLYVLWYVLVDKQPWAYVRGLLWWTSNFICFGLIAAGGKAWNGKLIRS